MFRQSREKNLRVVLPVQKSQSIPTLPGHHLCEGKPSHTTTELPPRNSLQKVQIYSPNLVVWRFISAMGLKKHPERRFMGNDFSCDFLMFRKRKKRK